MRERRAGAVWPAAPAGAQTAKGVHHPEGRGMGGTTALPMPSLRACRAIPGGAGTATWVAESLCLKRLSTEELLKAPVQMKTTRLSKWTPNTPPHIHTHGLGLLQEPASTLERKVKDDIFSAFLGDSQFRLWQRVDGV